MNPFLFSTIVWGGLILIFLGLELPAVYRLVPWSPMSDWIWELERPSNWIRFALIVAVGVLLVHLAAKFPLFPWENPGGA